ncbi:helix-turn-helix domain-containing protein [Mycobacteroides chelonae]|uniref:helix-turn-helix domain-containing protein n=2 Tax=Mycobacteriaceae TaxID=1762 RepID=UPI001F180E0C|nr:helix-turn-helix domain-containing protein [Mycobacteroides chelonae]
MYTATMTPQPFTHAVANPQTRRDIAAAVADGIPPEQLAAEFNISVSTVLRYAAEWEGAVRKAQALTDFEREAILTGVARGARRRWERQYDAEVVRHVMGEA